MTRRKPEPVDPAELPPPEVIAWQIEADLAKALREIRAVAKALEKPTPPPLGDQLSIDL